MQVGSGTFISPNVFLQGQTRIGEGCRIEPGCVIKDSDIKDHVVVKAYSHLESAIVHEECEVGPFARVRPKSTLGARSKIGNFVELKSVNFGEGSKAGHLTYLGDATIGKGTNIGCGTITCNYATDKKKYETHIGDDVFVGSDVQFVAPVSVGDGAFIGSGTTVTKDVPAKSLAVGRSKPTVIPNYQPKTK